MDFVKHAFDQEIITRNQWNAFEPRLIACGCLSWAYFFVFLRVLNLFRTNREIGPLQVSAAWMLLDFIQFFCIFGVIIFSFSLALTDLFWYYDTSEGNGVLCPSENGTISCSVVFPTILSSLYSLFWSIFGYFNLSDILFTDQLAFVHACGSALLGTYHVIAVIILINMLIAMMARTFEARSKKRDAEWKFHRTVVWIRFIQREFTRPPPMNLIPNPYTTCKHLIRFWKFLRGDQQFDEIQNQSQIDDNNWQDIVKTLTKRYKRAKLFHDCRRCRHRQKESE